MHNAAMVARSLGSRCLCHGDSDTARDTGRARGLQEISIDQLLKLALFMWFPGNASNESSSHPSVESAMHRPGEIECVAPDSDFPGSVV